LETALILLAVMLSSMAVSGLLAFKSKFGLQVGMDLPDGVQKVHRAPVPRTGGLAVFAGLILGAGLLAFPGELMPILAAAVPAWLCGSSEDLTRKRSPLSRLLATMASGLLLATLAAVCIPRLDLPIDPFIPPVLWVLFTCFAVSGLSNAINIIDGVNGLASFAAAAMFACLAFVAESCGDTANRNMALLGLGASCGFFLVNWPRGRLFLGDGGAYLIGFWLAATAISLVQHNSNLSAWFALAVFIYPVTETIFSLYRRRFLHRVGATVPDRLHLHSLVYWRRSRGKRSFFFAWINPNSATLFRLMPIVVIPPLGACLAAESTAWSIAVILLAVGLYIVWFRRIAQFKGGHRDGKPKVSIEASMPSLSTAVATAPVPAKITGTAPSRLPTS